MMAQRFQRTFSQVLLVHLLFQLLNIHVPHLVVVIINIILCLLAGDLNAGGGALVVTVRC